MRANTPLELWKKVFEKTFPPKVGTYMSAAQLLFSQNSSNITTNFCLSSRVTGISVSLSSHVSSNLFNSYIFKRYRFVCSGALVVSFCIFHHLPTFSNNESTDVTLCFFQSYTVAFHYIERQVVINLSGIL